jgi:hypothetical protein
MFCRERAQLLREYRKRVHRFLDAATPLLSAKGAFNFPEAYAASEKLLLAVDEARVSSGAAPKTASLLV